MRTFYRRQLRDDHENVIGLRIFALPEGRACVVSWSVPEPAMQAFVPNSEQPDATGEALPYAVLLCQRLNALRVSVELDEGMAWDGQWGELTDLPRG